jgi:hypothetical protein
MGNTSSSLKKSLSSFSDSSKSSKDSESGFFSDKSNDSSDSSFGSESGNSSLSKLGSSLSVGKEKEKKKSSWIPSFNFFNSDSSSSSSGSSSSSSSSDSSGSSGSSDSSGSSQKKTWTDTLFGNESSEAAPAGKDKSSKTSFWSEVSKTLQGNSYLERFVFVILVVISFVILLSVGSNILSAIVEPANPYLVDGLYTATNSKIIEQDAKKSGSVPITRSDNETYGIEFSWSVWMNVTGLDDSPGNTGQYKHVFSKGDNNNVPMDSRGLSTPNNSPGLYIDKTTNALVVIMNTFEQIEEIITITDVPMNKWMHVLIRVEGAFFDVYVNGTLAKRKVLASVPKQNNGNVYICQNGGFSGFISNLRYYRSALDPGDILSIVNRGPSLKLSSLEKKDLKNGNLNYLAMDWYFHNAR